VTAAERVQLARQLVEQAYRIAAKNPPLYRAISRSGESEIEVSQTLPESSDIVSEAWLLATELHEPTPSAQAYPHAEHRQLKRVVPTRCRRLRLDSTHVDSDLVELMEEPTGGHNHGRLDGKPLSTESMVVADVLASGGWSIRTLADPSRPARGDVSPETQTRVRELLVAQERERLSRWRFPGSTKELLRGAVRRLPASIDGETIARVTGIHPRTIRSWRMYTLSAANPLRVQARASTQQDTLNRIAAMESRLDEILRLTAETAERLRERFPTNADVTAAVDTFIERAQVPA